MKARVQIRERVTDPVGLLGQRVNNQVPFRDQAQVWNQVEGQTENGLCWYVQETLKSYASN